MATLPIQTHARNAEIDQLTFTAADAGLSDEYLNDGYTVCMIKNDSAGVITVTVASVAEPVYARTGDLSVAVPANSIGFVPPLSRSGFNDANGKVQLTASASASLSYAIVSLKRAVQ